MGCSSTKKGTKPMAVKLIANYAKRLGLPGYSSHQFSVSVETELNNVTDIAGESVRLYETLQKTVDEQMQQTGFVPPDGYGLNGTSNGNGHRERAQPEWRCRHLGEADSNWSDESSGRTTPIKLTSRPSPSRCLAAGSDR